MAKTQSLLEKCFQDKAGRIVIWQKPNLPLIAGLLCWLVSLAITGGIIHDIFSLVGFGAFFTWAWLEFFVGTTYFRRGLGFIVLVALIYNQVS